MKKILSILLSVLFFVSSSLTAFAEEPPEEKYIPVTEEVASELALNWVNSIYPELSLSSGNITKMYDLNDKQIGYSVGLYQGTIPYGYVILDFTKEDIIAEYSVAEGALDMVTMLEEKTPATYADEVNDTSHFYRTEPYTYSIMSTASDTEILIDNYGQILTDEDCQNYVEQTRQLSSVPLKEARYDPGDYMIMISSDMLLTYYTIINSNFHALFNPISEAYTESMTSSYCCSIQAGMINLDALNILDYQNYATDHDNLWNCCHASVYETTNGIEYGSTHPDEYNAGFANFLMTYKGLSGITYAANNNPGLSFFQSAIDSKRVCTYSYWLNGSNTGHTVAVGGYLQAKGSEGNDVPMIMVADGWYTETRYINLNYSSITDQEGVSWFGVNVPF